LFQPDAHDVSEPDLPMGGHQNDKRPVSDTDYHGHTEQSSTLATRTEEQVGTDRVRFVPSISIEK